MTTTTTAPARLGTTDRFLPVWILAAMAAGLLLAVFVPAFGELLHSFQVGQVSVPIAVGLLVMMYPVLAKVRYSDTRAIAGDRRLLVSSLVMNWVVGPALMPWRGSSCRICRSTARASSSWDSPGASPWS
jgi:ACR3 family arsenite transporter